MSLTNFLWGKSAKWLAEKESESLHPAEVRARANRGGRGGVRGGEVKAAVEQCRVEIPNDLRGLLEVKTN